MKSRMGLLLPFVALVGAESRATPDGKEAAVDFGVIRSPIIFQGDTNWAYRDPTAVYHDKTFHLYFTVSEMDRRNFYNRTAMSTSRDLVHWTKT